MPDNRKPLMYGAFPVCRNYTVRAQLCQFAAGQRRPHEADSGMAWPQRLFHHRQCLCASGMQFQTALGSGYDKRFAGGFECDFLMRQIKKSEQSEPCSDWRRWRDLNPRAGFLRRPPGFQDRSLQPLGYISKCIPAPTFLGKRRETWREIPIFS